LIPTLTSFLFIRFVVFPKYVNLNFELCTTLLYDLFSFRSMFLYLILAIFAPWSKFVLSCRLFCITFYGIHIRHQILELYIVTKRML
jgi:hypothetical protein